MQELLRVNNIGSKGINTDLLPWELPVEYITSGLNFRIYAGKITASGGSKHWIDGPILDAGHIFSINTPSNQFWISLSRRKAHVYDGTQWYDISPYFSYDDFHLDEFKWTSSLLGQIPIINNPQAFPQYWSPQGATTRFRYLDFKPGKTFQQMGYSCDVMRAHKTFLFALNLHEGAADIPDGYRWSTSADINGLPYTWDETDLSALAGKASLGGNGGQIIDGLSLRDSFVIYSENSIDILDYTGGEFVWRRRELSNTYGLLSINSIVEIKGVHFFLSDGDIFKNDGTSITSILYGRIRNQFSTRINTEFYFRSFVIRNDAHKEIWFCVPIDESETPNAAYVYNWKEESWAVRLLPDGLAYGNYGFHEDEGIDTQPIVIWDQWKGDWDEQDTIWESRTITPLNTAIIGVLNETGEMIVLDTVDNRDTTAATCTLERDNMVIGDQRAVKTVTRVYPHMIGTTPVNISLGAQQFAGGPITWKPYVKFTPGVDRKVDIRSTGMLHSWRIETNNDSGGVGVGNWSLSGLDFEYAVNGVR